MAGNIRRPPKDQSSLSLKSASFWCSDHHSGKAAEAATNAYARPRKSGGFTKMPHCSLSHAILIGDLADVASCPARAVEEIQPPAPKPSQAGQLMKFNPP